MKPQQLSNQEYRNGIEHEENYEYGNYDFVGSRVEPIVGSLLGGASNEDVNNQGYLDNEMSQLHTKDIYHGSKEGLIVGLTDASIEP